MTSITFTVDHGAGPVAYSDYVLEADIWRDTQTGVGRWQVLMDPQVNYWPTLYNVDEAASISINGVLMMNGYVDDVKPYLDSRGYHTDLWLLNGRDLGLDLAQYFYKKLSMGGARSDYVNTLSGNIIRDVINNMRATFGGGNPEINPPAAGIGNNIDFDWLPRMSLADGVKEIALLDNHDFYVDDATTNFTYFPVGSVASGVTLIDFAASTTNNILELEVGEQLGLELKNYIEPFAGSLYDHYTELNGTDNAATGWNSGNATCTVGNNTGGGYGPAGFEWLNGRNAVYCERSIAPAGNRIEMYLDFAALTTGYNQGGSVDLSDSSYIRYLAIQEDTDAGGALGNNVSVGLQDTGGNVIYYARWQANPPNKYGFTADLTNNKWYEITCHIGYDTQIQGVLTTDYWYFDVGGAPFNWSAVDRIWFSTLQVSPNPSWFVVDGLHIPTVDVSALAQDAASIAAYGYRMRAVDRRDIVSQFELQDYADDYLAKHKDPLESIRCTASGQTGTPYAGETVEVVAPDLGVGGPNIGDTVTYRILKLHHQVVRNSRESTQEGYNFLTTYDLAKNEVDGSDQEVDTVRYYGSVDPQQAVSEHRRRELTWRMRQQIKTAYAR